MSAVEFAGVSAAWGVCTTCLKGQQERTRILPEGGLRQAGAAGVRHVWVRWVGRCVPLLPPLHAPELFVVAQ